MKNIRARLLGLGTLAISASVAFSVIVYSRSQSRTIQDSLKFPIDVLKEERARCLRGDGWDWNVSVFIHRQNYSTVYLEHLFNSYSSYYSNLEDHLLVAVYTDLSRDATRNSSVQDSNQLVEDWDAIFKRERDPLFITPYNAWYRYSVDLDHPSHKKTVVITGVDPFAPDVDLALVRIPTPAKAYTGEQSPIGFGFDEISQEAPGADTYHTRRVRVLLAKEHYNRTNLERLFRFYSDEYPNIEYVLEIQVYTDVDNVKRELVDRHRPGYMSVTAKFPHQTKHGRPPGRLPYYDAYFQRIGNSPLVGGKNELYTYRPNLEIQEKTEKIILSANNRGKTN